MISFTTNSGVSFQIERCQHDGLWMKRSGLPDVVAGLSVDCFDIDGGIMRIFLPASMRVKCDFTCDCNWCGGGDGYWDTLKIDLLKGVAWLVHNPFRR
jgi:hypothetical protein